jgi:2-dehydropantoate 2-reductase
MRHAMIGAGGIGGLVAGALARSGEDVVVLLRPESLAAYGGRLRVESVVLGDFEVDVPGAAVLADAVDVLWVAPKATQLEPALALAPSDAVGEATVVPLLNGVDHMALLRRRYANVVGAAIRVESERVLPGVIREKSPFIRVDIAGAPAVQDALRAAGIDVRPRHDEQALLWEKLVFLAPVALATSALDGPIGAVRHDESFVGCRAEAYRAARAAGAVIDLPPIAAAHESVPGEMRSSMQKDVAAGREPELDAIAGPIVRGGRDHGFATDATERLVAQIEARLAHG